MHKLRQRYQNAFETKFLISSSNIDPRKNDDAKTTNNQEPIVLTTSTTTPIYCARQDYVRCSNYYYVHTIESAD